MVLWQTVRELTGMGCIVYMRQFMIDLWRLLLQMAIPKCTIPLERDSGRKRGFGFVEMTSKSSEKTAIDDLQDVEWMGREIRVNKAEQKDRSRRNNRHHGS